MSSMSTDDVPNQLPPGMYLATPAPSRAPSADQDDESTGDLAELEADVLTTRLTATLHDLGAYADDVANRHRGDTDPAPVELMAAICEGPDANLLFGSLARRVRAGAITWQQIWQDPREYDGGLRLLGEVLRRQATDPPDDHPGQG